MENFVWPVIVASIILLFSVLAGVLNVKNPSPARNRLMVTLNSSALIALVIAAAMYFIGSISIVVTRVP